MKSKWKKSVSAALQEDLGEKSSKRISRDITSALVIPKSAKSKAVIVAKESGVLAGGNVVKEVFKTINPKIKVNQKIREGAKFKKGTILFEINGSTVAILTAERTALNFLCHLSGIATLTNKFTGKIKGTRAKILDTRKTTPGLRELEKYAVRCGGGMNHRMGLWDMILIKDNHIKAVGSIRKALENVFQKPKGKGRKLKVEVEVRNLAELKEALRYPVNRVMLDNMDIKKIKKATSIARSQKPRVKIEASGGINLGNVKQIAQAGVDYISVGVLTHSVPAIDMSLELI